MCIHIWLVFVQGDEILVMDKQLLILLLLIIDSASFLKFSLVVAGCVRHS